MEQLHNINEGVINGEMNPLQAYIELKRIESLLKDVMKGVQEEAITEAEKYGKGEHEAFGAKFQVKNAGGRWNYKNNQQWLQLSTKIKGLEEQLKAAHKAGGTLIDEETGEVIGGAEFSEGKTTIAIKL